MKKITCLVMLLVLCITTKAQTPVDKLLKAKNVCASHIEEAKLLEDKEYSTFNEKREAQYREKMIELRKKREQGLEEKAPPVYTLPVVVHIVHSGAELGTDANRTDADVQAIVNTASQRFRHQHTGAGTYTNSLYGVDTEIEFCFANTDPSGNYTTGIIRHYDTDLAYFDYDNGESVSEFNSILWPQSDYVNLVVPETLTGAAGVYFGSVDATFYDSGIFWSGLVAHEIGHHFNLRHTFQGGCPNGNCLSNGDNVCDTPPKGNPGFNGGTCAAPNNECDTDDDDTSANNPYAPVPTGIGDQPDMLANYMDYTGSCWDAFTQGQKDRMRNDITTFRIPLTNSNGCDFIAAPALDVGIGSISIVGSPCNSDIIPTVTLYNYGVSTLTSVTIISKSNGITFNTYNWTGSLTSGNSINVVLPTSTLSTGNFLITSETSMPNGGTDGYTNNDTAYKNHSISGSGTLPYSEDFESGTFPPTGTTLDNPDSGITWGSDGTVTQDCLGGTNTAASINNYSYNSTGQRDILRLPAFDLSSYTSATLTFDVAYAPYSATYSDELNVEVSNACGTPTVEYAKDGLTLATNSPAAYVTSAFDPACTEWRNETVDLSSYTGSGFTQVIIDFVNITGYGNVLYIDNINLVGSSGCSPTLVVGFPISSGTYDYEASNYVTGSSVISGSGTSVVFDGGSYVELVDGFEAVAGCDFSAIIDGCGGLKTDESEKQVPILSENTLNCYPNPFSEMATIEFTLNDDENVNLYVIDAMGRIVMTIKQGENLITGKHQVNIDGSKLQTGIYYVFLQTKSQSVSKKLMVVR